MSDMSKLSSTITPEKGISTRMPVKQKNADDTRHLLMCAGFKDKTNTYLFEYSTDIPP